MGPRSVRAWRFAARARLRVLFSGIVSFLGVSRLLLGKPRNACANRRQRGVQGRSAVFTPNSLGHGHFTLPDGTELRGEVETFTERTEVANGRQRVNT